MTSADADPALLRFLLPFGRGSLNITNNDPYSGQVARDPRYWCNRFDLLASAATLRYARTLATGLGPLFVSEIAPGFAAVPANATLDQFADYLKQGNYGSSYHYLGGASMQSRSLGGSVNPKHQVYGTQGLRIMDASILHTQVTAHMMRSAAAAAASPCPEDKLTEADPSSSQADLWPRASSPPFPPLG